MGNSKSASFTPFGDPEYTAFSAETDDLYIKLNKLLHEYDIHSLAFSAPKKGCMKLWMRYKKNRIISDIIKYHQKMCLLERRLLDTIQTRSNYQQFYDELQKLSFDIQIRRGYIEDGMIIRCMRY